MIIRLQQQYQAKTILEKCFPSANLTQTLSHQYMITLKFYELACEHDYNKIDVIGASMNGGKSKTLTTHLLNIMRTGQYSRSLIGSYFGAVAVQFMTDLIEFSTLREMSKVLDGKRLTIVGTYTEDQQNHVRSLYKKGKIGNITLISVDQVSSSVLESMCEMSDYVVYVTLIQSLNPELATIKFGKANSIFEGHKTIAFLDEFHSGTASESDTIANIDYREATGYSTPFNARLLHSIKSLGFDKIIGMTGTPTLAHLKDDEFFRIHPNVITREETEEYSKKTVALFNDDEIERYSIGIRELKRVNDYTGFKNVAVFAIRNESKMSLPTEQYVSIIKSLAVENGLCTLDDVDETVILFTSDEGASSYELVDRCHSQRDKLRIVVVKRRLGAGINIKNISVKVMGRDATNPRDIHNSLFQFWSRGIRWNNLINPNVRSWKDIDLFKYPTVRPEYHCNIMTYILPLNMSEAYDKYVEDYVFDLSETKGM